MDSWCPLIYIYLTVLAVAVLPSDAASTRSKRSALVRRQQYVIESVSGEGLTELASEESQSGSQMQSSTAAGIDANIKAHSAAAAQEEETAPKTKANGRGRSASLMRREVNGPGVVSPDSAPTKRSFFPPLSFFQMGSSEQTETVVDAEVAKDTAKTMQTNYAAGQIHDSKAGPSAPAILESNGEQAVSAVELSDSNGVVTLHSVAGNQSAMGDTAAADDANVSAEVEGVWLLMCLLGLVTFSCTMVCIIRTCPVHFCAAPRTVRLLSEPADDTPACSTDRPQETEVSSFEAVVDAARAAEAEVLEKVGSAGVEELLSSVSRYAQEPEEVKGTSDSCLALSSNVIRDKIKILEPAADILLDKLQAGEESAGGYDCVVPRPMISSTLVRLHATVLPPSNSDILAPLSLKKCVLYQVTVSRRLHVGMPPVPVAFSSGSATFHVSSCERPDLNILVDGAGVMLFDMDDGHFAFQGTFADAPGNLQDYVLTHRSSVPGGRWQTSSSLRMDNTPLEFEECALLVGSKVTLVGDLGRDGAGELVLKPTCMPELSVSSRVLVSDDAKLC